MQTLYDKGLLGIDADFRTRLSSHVGLPETH